jgi:hypothetical protein
MSYDLKNRISRCYLNYFRSSCDHIRELPCEKYTLVFKVFNTRGIVYSDFVKVFNLETAIFFRTVGWYDETPRAISHISIDSILYITFPRLEISHRPSERLLVLEGCRLLVLHDNVSLDDLRYAYRKIYTLPDSALFPLIEQVIIRDVLDREQRETLHYEATKWRLHKTYHDNAVRILDLLTKKIWLK